MAKTLVRATFVVSIIIWVSCLLLIFLLDPNDVNSDAEVIEVIEKLEAKSSTMPSCPPPPPYLAASVNEPEIPTSAPVVRRFDDGHLHASTVMKSREEQQNEPNSERDIIYESMYKCQAPKFNRTSPNPCWTGRNGKLYCAASVMLIGFHKTGSTDLSKWFLKDEKNFASAPDDYFFHPHNNQLLYSDCPHQYLEEKIDQVNYMKAASSRGAASRIFVDCPGCLVIGHTVHTYPGAVIRRSTVQYLHYFLTSESRYIVSLRNPTERALSHYFYSFQQKNPHEFPEWENITDIKEIGYDYLHSKLEEELAVIQQCHKELGVKQCVLDITSGAYRKQFALNLIIHRGCYVVFIKEAMKFIPKERMFFSLMETYSNQTERVVTEMMKFIGIPPPTRKLLDENISRRENVGKDKPAHQKTRDLLNKFYAPFNKELADILKDPMYLFSN